MSQKGNKEPRDRQLNLSLTASELKNLHDRALALGMRPAHLGRALLLDNSRKLVSSRQPEDATSRLIYGQLVRLGNNLNQLVRHLHRTGAALPPDLEPLLADIRALIAKASR